MAASPDEMYYTTLDPLAVLDHFVDAKEREGGARAIIVRDLKKNTLVPEEFKPYVKDANDLFDPLYEGLRNVVFFQTSTPGRPFGYFDKEKTSMVMTLYAYGQLMKFFKERYEEVLKRLDGDKTLLMGTDSWTLLYSDSRYIGHSSYTYRKLLESQKHNELHVYIQYNTVLKKTSVHLKYAHEDAPPICLPPTAMTKLALSSERTFQSLQYNHEATQRRRSLKTVPSPR